MTDLIPIAELAPDAQYEPSASIGPRGQFRWIKIADCYVDIAYQRSIERQGLKTIRKIVEGFSWPKFTPLVVTEDLHNPGRYMIIDGQHRAVAAFLHPDVVEIPAFVHVLDLKDQARVFRDVNAVKTGVTSLQVYKAGLIAGDSLAIGVDNVTRQAGVTVLPYQTARPTMRKNECICVNGISQSLKRSGYAAVLRALLTLRQVPTGAGSVISATAVKVLSIMFADNPDLSVDRTIQVLRKNDFEDIKAQVKAKTSSNLMQRMADAIKAKVFAL